MEIRHKCKLCSRTFTNGRALGGHMKAHLAALPLPPPKPQPFVSFSCSFESDEEESSDSEEQEVVVTQREKNSEEKALIYGLRENPKKSFRLADPEFSAALFSAPVQDRESENESKTHNKPTRQRSKRNSKPAVFPFSAEPEPVSSVSDPSPDEDVAMCLMMLSRDTRRLNVNNVQQQNHNNKHFKNRVRGKNLCETCGKVFRSSRALGSHKSICCRNEERNSNKKIFECPFCYKVFGSGQALGGHKRSHLIASSSSISTVNDSVRFKESFIDLNLPAPMEEDELSVLSDA